MFALDIKNPIIAKEVLMLQRESYAIEASLINYDKVPPLMETLEALTLSQEDFYGYREQDILTGMISIEYNQSDCTICRLAISPQHFKKAIATALLDYIETAMKGKRLIVTTAATNIPAVNLYIKRGFRPTERLLVDSLTLQRFEKI